MDDITSGWRGIIQRNLTSLTDCTVVTSDMVAQLINHRLINRSEEHSLMNSWISDHERALVLYRNIARKWNDEGFENFTLVLAESLNTRALDILKNEQYKALSDPFVLCKGKVEVQEKMEDLETLEKTNKKLKLEKLEEAPGLSNQMSSKIYAWICSVQGSPTGNQTSSEEDMTKNLIQAESVIMMRDEQTLSTTEKLQPRSHRRLHEKMEVLKVSPEKPLIGRQAIWRLGDETPFDVKKIMGIWYRIEQLEENTATISETVLQTYTYTMRGDTIRCKTRIINSDEDEVTTSFNVNSLSSHHWTIKVPCNILPLYWLLRVLGDKFERLWLATDYNNWAILSWGPNGNSSKRSVIILSRTPTASETTLQTLRELCSEILFKKFQ